MRYPVLNELFNIEAYLCDPFCHGKKENTNKPLRRYLPRHTDPIPSLTMIYMSFKKTE